MSFIFKPKKCKECTSVFTPERNLQYICTPECSYVYLNKLRAKKKAADWKIEKLKLSEGLKTLSDFEKEAKVVFQKWVRMRDADLPCISCENKSNRYDGGHYYPAGIYSGTIFNELNCNKQCSFNCNKMLHGNIQAYRVGLIKKYGKEAVEDLDTMAIITKSKKYTKSELIEIKEKYSKLIREMKHNGNNH